MTSQFSIGQFEFISLSQCRVVSGEQVEIEAKPGVDGVNIWQTGKRGDIWEATSSVNARTVQEAESLAIQYQNSKGQNPVQMKWAGVVIPGKLFMVLNVVPLESQVFATLTSVGGIFDAGTPTYGFVRARWTLLDVS